MSEQVLDQIVDYRDMLSHEYKRRVSNNPRYSYRAFARHLGVASSTLTEMLAGKHHLSPRVAERVAKRLGLSEGDVERFCDLVILARLHRSNRNDATGKQEAFAWHKLGDKTFAQMADWHCMAIPELTKLKAFKSEPRWIAKMLGVAESDVTIAISRLTTLGLLKERAGTLVAVKPRLTTTEDVSSSAIRAFHSQMIGKAGAAVYNQRVSERELMTGLVATDAKGVKMARTRLRKFVDSLSKELAARPAKDRLYCLSVQLFRASQEGDV